MFRKHLGSDATPPLLEQYMMVKSYGMSVRDAMESGFLQRCLSHFLQKERRCANASLSRSPGGTLKIRRRAPRSDKGKKRSSYTRRKNNTVQLQGASNFRLLVPSQESCVQMEECQGEAVQEKSSIYDAMSPRRGQKKQE